LIQVNSARASIRQPDEIADVRPGVATMPRYFFVLRWPDKQHDDREGTQLPSARRPALTPIIRELKEGGGYDDPALTTVVRDSSGKILLTIPL
jgi:hypothetical protein